MPKRLAPLLLLAVLAGCGSAHHPSGPKPCQPRKPPALGECVGQHFGLSKPTARSGKRCVDWSRWNGTYPSTLGVSCVIIQSNYGLNVEPGVYSQIRDANEHHVPWGAYTFMEGASGAAEANLAVSVTNGHGRTLGIWADAEIGAAYSQACSYLAEAHALNLHIFGLYSAPGIYRGGHCAGYLWPAEWGASAPYAFGGYPSSAVVLWQYSGTGTLDLDADWGLIALVQPPVPSAALHRELLGLYRTRSILRADLQRRGCPGAYPLCPRWAREGRAAQARITALHRKGIW